MATTGTVTTVVPVMGIAMDAERIMDMDMAADQGMSGVRGVGDKARQGSLSHCAGHGFLRRFRCKQP